MLPSCPSVPSPHLFLRSALCSQLRVISCLPASPARQLLAELKIPSSAPCPSSCVFSHHVSDLLSPRQTQSLSWRNGLRLNFCPQAPLFPRLRASPPHVSLSQFPVSGNTALPASRFVISDSSLSNVKDGSTMKTSASSGNSLLSSPPSTSSSF